MSAGSASIANWTIIPWGSWLPGADDTASPNERRRLSESGVSEVALFVNLATKGVRGEGQKVFVVAREGMIKDLTGNQARVVYKQEYVVQVELSVAGTVDDFDAAAKADLKARLATVAGVDTSKVKLTIKEGSVVVTAEMAADSNTAASSLATSVSEQLDSPAAASALLGVTVTSTPSVVRNTRTVIDRGDGISVPTPPGSNPALVIGDDAQSGGGNDDGEGWGWGAYIGIICAVVTIIVAILGLCWVGACCFPARKKIVVTEVHEL